MKRLIVDFEFTGLDNCVEEDNEIISMSIINVDTKEKGHFIFDSDKENQPGSFLVNKIKRREQLGKEYFSFRLFKKILSEFSGVQENKLLKEVEIYGFGISTDKKMLSKYIENQDFFSEDFYKDVQDLLRISKRKDIFGKDLELSMALNGCSIETSYYLVTGKTIRSHKGTFEVESILRMFKKLQLDRVDQNGFYKYVPFGIFKGKEISKYVEENKSHSYGYMINNNDRFSRSIENSYYSDEEQY